MSRDEHIRRKNMTVSVGVPEPFSQEEVGWLGMLGAGDLLVSLMGGPFSNFPVNGQEAVNLGSILHWNEGLSTSAGRTLRLAELTF